ncbi:MAG: hypothetical protein ACO1N0_13870 [Fluviicola sp.]
MRFLPILIVGLLFSCNSGIDKLATKNQSSDDLDKIHPSEVNQMLRNQEDRFLIDGKAVVLKTKKFSRIHIPTDAFVKKDGSVPSGNVTLLFREYQSAGEILASGLPMVCKDKNGKQFDFESAGMFEIRALDGEDTLFLKEGKEIKVELATPTSGKFNFYELNDNTRAWKEKKRDLPAIRNPYLKQISDSLAYFDDVVDKGVPRKAIEYKPSDNLFDIQVDPDEYPEFKEIGGVMWKYIGQDTKNDPANNPDYFTRKYAFADLSPAKGNLLSYHVSFVSNGDTLTLLMAPAFPGKLKNKYQKKLEEKLKKFNEALEAAQSLRKQQRNESELLRVFNVDKLGIYNYDRQLKGDPLPVIASFFLGDKPQSEFKNLNVYLIPKEKLCVVKYDLGSAQMFAIDLGERNQLIAISAPNEIYALSDDDIRKLNLAKFRSKKCEIHLKKIDKKVTSGAGIDQILASL